MACDSRRCIIVFVTMPAPMSPFAWFETPWGPTLRCEALEPYARHVFTTRGLDLPHADNGSGWTTLAEWLGVESSHLWRLRQVHGLTVHTDSVAPCDGAWPEGDLLATDRQISFETLEQIHRGKTGALFVASAAAGALTAGAGPDQQQWLVAFAKNLGLAFQIIDDLLDVEGDPAETGKAVREDARKTTFVSFSGVAGARQLAMELCETADRALAPFGRRADRIRELSAFVAARSV